MTQTRGKVTFELFFGVTLCYFEVLDSLLSCFFFVALDVSWLLAMRDFGTS